jgi:hypothetical protein
VLYCVGVWWPTDSKKKQFAKGRATRAPRTGQFTTEARALRGLGGVGASTRARLQNLSPPFPKSRECGTGFEVCARLALQTCFAWRETASEQADGENNRRVRCHANNIGGGGGWGRIVILVCLRWCTRRHHNAESKSDAAKGAAEREMVWGARSLGWKKSWGWSQRVCVHPGSLRKRGGFVVVVVVVVGGVVCFCVVPVLSGRVGATKALRRELGSRSTHTHTPATGSRRVTSRRQAQRLCCGMTGVAHSRSNSGTPGSGPT